MQKEIIIPVVFLIAWIIAMAWWGASKNIKADLSNNQPQQEYQFCDPKTGCW